jgi:tryptophan-rich sensory protein
MQTAATSEKFQWVGLVVSLVICFAIAGLGSLATTPEIPGWYRRLNKPPWTPPDWLFGPVWSFLYAAMAVAAWLVWRNGGWRQNSYSLWLFVIQLALNLAWSFIFFRFHRVGLAFAEIVLLWVAIALTLAAFASVSKIAGLLLAPYLVWVGYAAALNFAIWRMNSGS